MVIIACHPEMQFEASIFTLYYEVRCYTLCTHFLLEGIKKYHKNILSELGKIFHGWKRLKRTSIRFCGTVCKWSTFETCITPLSRSSLWVLSQVPQGEPTVSTPWSHWWSLLWWPSQAWRSWGCCPTFWWNCERQGWSPWSIHRLLEPPGQVYGTLLCTRGTVHLRTYTLCAKEYRAKGILESTTKARSPEVPHNEIMHDYAE